jgi:hypothetical protein
LDLAQREDRHLPDQVRPRGALPKCSIRPQYLVGLEDLEADHRSQVAPDLLEESVMEAVEAVGAERSVVPTEQQVVLAA